MKVDWLIVGAGFSGATLAERLATEAEQTVLLIDRRDHVGGNAFDEYSDDHHLVHRYGPHIFHTNSEKVFRYLSRFTAWRPYEHRVRAHVHGHLVPVPFNLDSVRSLVPTSACDRITDALVREYGLGAKVPILRLRESEDRDVQWLADFVYENIFEGYTLKMWGVRPEDLDPSVTGRVPVMVGFDDRYFQDRFQAMPVPSYSRLFQRMLGHPNIKILLKTDLHDVANSVEYRRMIFTGPIDEFFDVTFGRLPYRSLRFEFERFAEERRQPVATLNAPNSGSHTRTTEQRYLTGQDVPGTTIVTEYPEPYQPGMNEPYYPVPMPENRELFAKYDDLARRERPDVVFAGRLADYKYYNMDQAVGRALHLFETNPLLQEHASTVAKR